MGKEKDFSAFIKYGHVLYYFFPVLFIPVWKNRKKQENKTHWKIR